MKQLHLGAISIGLVLLAGCPEPMPRPGPGLTGTTDGGTATSTGAGTATGPTCTTPPTAIKPRVSLAITDLAILDDRFSMKRVMTKLLQTANSTQMPEELYQRLFDTNNAAQNPTANDAKQVFVQGGQHCDDQRDSNNNPTLNGFPVQCPRQEGGLADLSAHNPFCTGAGCDPYVPIGLFNRLDVAPDDFSNCGEIHLLYGRKPQRSSGSDRTLIIFEALMPNPNPSSKSMGCVPLAQFWADLSNVSDPQMRAQKLEQFLFTGFNGGPPVIDISHFTAKSLIRTDQFKNNPGLGQNWQLREYQLKQTCNGNQCTVGVTEVTVKRNPFSALFDSTNSSALAKRFQDPAEPKGFISQVQRLAQAQSIADIGVDTDNVFNSGQSTSQTGGPQNQDTNYAAFFKGGNTAFRSAIQAKLTQIGSSLTPDDIVRRAQTQACGGCHQISNGAQLGGGLVWPPSLGFVQVSELQPEACPPETGTDMCWPVSPAINQFLQARLADFEIILNGNLCPGTAPMVRTAKRVVRPTAGPEVHHRTPSTH